MPKLTFGTTSDSESSLPPPGENPSLGETEVTPTPKRRGRPPGSTNKTNLANLEQKLTEKLLEELVVPVAFASPLAAANIEARAERTAKAATRMAAKNPAVRKSIERFLDGSDVFTLLLFPLSTAVCFMVDWGMVPPASIPARAVGVPVHWETAYGEPFPYNGAEEPSQNGHVETDSPSSRGLNAQL